MYYNAYFLYLLAFTIEEMSIFSLKFPHIDFPIEKCVDCVSSGVKGTVIVGIIFGIDTNTPKSEGATNLCRELLQEASIGSYRNLSGWIGSFFWEGLANNDPKKWRVKYQIGVRQIYFCIY